MISLFDRPAAVLLLMLFATLFTVVGVTRPVRRLTEATRRIARGAQRRAGLVNRFLVLAPPLRLFVTGPLKLQGASPQRVQQARRGRDQPSISRLTLRVPYFANKAAG
jgi:hypothetical protein